MLVRKTLFSYVTWVRRLSHKIHPVALILTGAALWAAALGVKYWLHRALLGRLADLRAIQASEEPLAQELYDRLSLRDLNARDLRQFKLGLSKLAESKRVIYESGLLLQEEKRLLEKQLEIMTTYLLVDEAAKKISLMRGEQSLESLPIGYSPALSFGAEGKPRPPVVQIVSKERFAHPERGKYEEVGGKLQWEPPQVGTSVRANALGEYVMFTNSRLILHGPPKKVAEHDEFAHDCLGLPLVAARRLYETSFIGTKILFKAEKPQPALKPAPSKN